ncbi:MSCRAMM family protein [Enterococcus hermanniensis]|uniref:MSCRAMM family protein n=1 Tax=Enterococcus hermanniensis TaxID=249189 RepID=UPI00361DBEFD
MFAKGLSAGDYVLKEVKAPTGYILDTTAHKFTVYPQVGKVTATQLGTLENYQGSVELTKVDTANVNQTLAGANFQLLDANHKVVKTDLTTNGQGQITVTGLAPGKYAFKETKAPNGYQLATQTIDFTIAASHKGQPVTVKVTAENTKTPPSSNHKNHSRGNSHKWYYPKTGEEKARFLAIIGGVIIIVVIGLIVWRKKRQ